MIERPWYEPGTLSLYVYLWHRAGRSRLPYVKAKSCSFLLSEPLRKIDFIFAQNRLAFRNFYLDDTYFMHYTQATLSIYNAVKD